MAKNYKVWEKYYLPVGVNEIDNGYLYPVRVVFNNGNGTNEGHNAIKNMPDLLLTAEEVIKENYPLWDGVNQMDRITALEAANASLKESLHEASEENLANDEALAQMSVKKAELEAENEKLKQQLADANELLSDAQAKVKELTEADCMRLQEFKPIIEERDRLKAEVATRTDNVKNLVEENDRLKKLLNSKEEGMRKIEEYADQLKKIADDLGDENEKLKAENDQERKRTQVWKDASEEHRQAAEELKADIERYEEDKTDLEWEVKRNESEINKLHADNLELKAQINAFGNGEDRETLKKKLNAHEKIATIHRKAITGLGKTVKEKDCIISALVKRVMELEKGGESNG